MKNLFYAVSVFFALFQFSPQVEATHNMGVDASWFCINACTTRIQFNAYRDCSGLTMAAPVLNFLLVNGSGAAPVPVGPGWSTAVVTEITPVCPGTLTNCSGGAVPGVEEYYWYRDYDICSSNGATFALEYSNCCRNASITSGAANQQFYFNATTLNTGVIPCNNSPVFANAPFFFVCNSSPTTISQGAYDPDGDSLVFALSSCYAGNGTPVNYSPGYSPGSPLGSGWSVTMDPNDGTLSLTPIPGNICVAVLCYTISEYRNGQLIGTHGRDMQVAVVNCGGNMNPEFNSFANLSPGATANGNTVNTTAGTPLCFDLPVVEFNAGQTTRIYWDGNIPGASFSDPSGPALDTIYNDTARFCWTPAQAGVYSFLATVEDDDCPFFGFEDKFITIVVTGCAPVYAPLITVTNAIDYCAGTCANVSAAAGYSTYLWNTGLAQSSFSLCDNSQEGLYAVSVTDLNGCVFFDSVNISATFPDIYGTVLSSTGAPLNNENVFLIAYDTIGGGTLTGLDTVQTDANGNYFFCGITNAVVYVKAGPNSIAWPNEMPTYANASLFWNAANSFNSSGFPTQVDFSTIFGSNPGGPGFIGGLISQGANKVQAPGDPIADFTLLLVDANSGVPLDITQTNASGYFSFGNIPVGDYKIYPDHPGISIHTDSIPYISLNVSDPVMDSLTFVLHPTWLEYLAFTGPIICFYPFEPEIFPNPSDGIFTLRWNTGMVDSEVQYSLTDLSGKVMGNGVSSGINRISIDAHEMGLSEGVYFLRVMSRGYEKTFKLVIAE